MTGVELAESSMMDGLGGGAREAVLPLPLLIVGETQLYPNILDYQAGEEEGL